MSTIIERRPPLPPFNWESAVEKVRAAENGWNSKDAEKVALAYTPSSVWRNRGEVVEGREQIINFLNHKWQNEHQYRLIKELWTHGDKRIAVRFAYEWHNDEGQWLRSYGNENWEFTSDGLMHRRFACISDLVINEEQRKFHWPSGSRPIDHPGLSELGL